MQNQVNIKEQLPKYLNASVKVVTTPCVLIETEGIGAVLTGALQILRRYPIHKCSHKEKPVGASRCIKSMVVPNNPSRYVVATQDIGLREKLREVAGVALIYLHGNAPTLEAPSEKSQAVASEKTARKTDIVGYQKEILEQMKKVNNLDQGEQSQHKGTKKRKRAGPNPLSCKKSKKAKKTIPSKAAPKPKRKRPKIRTPKHVKEEVVN
ncbi:unnamed protein product [Allacma fusca]|uniref:UTP23 sensor motif region domain-containing protein n=1 Tax=Allacma fusca TaxID=39272 RepID=A0A8J2LEB6_9HEXA|nr:unnamed protein product [Allacma fusca]